jgi:hypothetical protein
LFYCLGGTITVRLRLLTVFFIIQYFLAVYPSSGDARGVLLKWDPNGESDLAGYRVYAWNDPVNVLNPLMVAYKEDVYNTTATTQLTGLSPYLTYSIAVTAYNISGLESAYSNVVTIYPENTCQIEDINNDGYVDVADVMLALRIAVGQIAPSAAQLACGDVAPVINGVSTPNGKIYTGDAIVMLSRIVGKVIY